jgi:hypothetical protein
MKRLKLWLILSSIGLLALGSVVLPRAQEPGQGSFRSGSYLTIIKDAGGNPMSRSVITLNADQTMLSVDSAQQGPVNYFGDQLGAWKPAGHHAIAGRMINFRYLPGAPGIARSDYVISFGPDRRQMTGTVTLRIFPPDGNPLVDEGVLVGTFAFTGELIEP